MWSHRDRGNASTALTRRLAHRCMPELKEHVCAGVLDLEPWTTGCALLGMTNLTCIQQLLFKGLLHDDTRSLTISLLTQLLRQVGSCLRTRGQTTGIMTFQPGLGALASGGLAALPAVRGMDALFGICSHQLTTSILAGIPWVLSQRGSKAARPEVRPSKIFRRSSATHAHCSALESWVLLFRVCVARACGVVHASVSTLGRCIAICSGADQPQSTSQRCTKQTPHGIDILVLSSPPS